MSRVLRFRSLYYHRIGSPIRIIPNANVRATCDGWGAALLGLLPRAPRRACSSLGVKHSRLGRHAALAEHVCLFIYVSPPLHGWQWAYRPCGGNSYPGAPRGIDWQRLTPDCPISARLVGSAGLRLWYLVPGRDLSMRFCYRQIPTRAWRAATLSRSRVTPSASPADTSHVTSWTTVLRARKLSLLVM